VNYSGVRLGEEYLSRHSRLTATSSNLFGYLQVQVNNSWVDACMPVKWVFGHSTYITILVQLQEWICSDVKQADPDINPYHYDNTFVVVHVYSNSYSPMFTLISGRCPSRTDDIILNCLWGKL
jgi:hypothetical protein